MELEIRILNDGGGNENHEFLAVFAFMFAAERMTQVRNITQIEL